MIKRNQARIHRLDIFSDAVLIFVSFALASWLWLDIITGHPENPAGLRSPAFWAYALAYSLWTVGILALFHMYPRRRSQNRSQHYSILFLANTLSIACVATILFVFRLQEFSRGVLGLSFLFSTALLLAKRMAVSILLGMVRRKGYNLRHILVIGSGEPAAAYVQSVQTQPQLGLRIDEILPPGSELETDLELRIHGAGIDEVVLALDLCDLPQTERIVRLCERSGVQVSVIPFYYSVISSQPTIESVGTIQLIRLRTSPLEESVNAFFKRMFDIAASAVLLLLLSPLFLLIALLVRLSSPGPVIFRQERVGRNRKSFTMYKFRSMRQNDTETSAWSQAFDSRRTAIGALLRKSSLDELPQLWNVLKGDMSLVGPRPEIPMFVEQFRDTVPQYMLKHRIRPGITGLAQVQGYRGDTSIPERIRCDIRYMENWSFALDIRILLRTVFGGMWNRESLRRDTHG